MLYESCIFFPLRLFGCWCLSSIRLAKVIQWNIWIYQLSSFKRKFFLLCIRLFNWVCGVFNSIKTKNSRFLEKLYVLCSFLFKVFLVFYHTAALRHIYNSLIKNFYFRLRRDVRNKIANEHFRQLFEIKFDWQYLL